MTPEIRECTLWYFIRPHISHKIVKYLNPSRCLHWIPFLYMRYVQSREHIVKHKIKRFLSIFEQYKVK